MIKLFNKGKRTIIHAGQKFAPNESGQFTPEAAAKLKRLYGSELISLEDEVKRFESPAPEFKEKEKEKPLTAAEKAAATRAAKKAAKEAAEAAALEAEEAESEDDDSDQDDNEDADNDDSDESENS